MKSRSRNIVLLRSAAAVGLLFSAAAAHAQTAAAESETPSGEVHPEDDGEIVVTAQQREQRLVDVPVPVTQLSGALLGSLPW